MNEAGYFDNVNYTGRHLHIDNYKDQFTPFIEAIAWERQDKTMDVFFDDFKDDKELKALYGDKEYYYDDFMGVFLGNVKTDKEAYELFRDWVNMLLYTYRDKTK
ncbi:hypothetical protein M3221_16880 [Domibacillus indicus]|uniref:hypothetical protein n=1 Tax=Domibacillus indicus TaxID=1437523 RepID=UPI00203A8B63|nr:hypothetical protein [Domibacillus indicus]MCM3790064.1 hypothetical protein [Domibacillus indicus]